MTVGGPRRRGRPPGSHSTPRTRSAILRSAREVFSRVGYERATLRDIADGAEVTRPAVTYHFAGKQAIHQALLDEVAEDMSGVGDTIAARQDDPRRAIATFLHAAVERDRKDRSVSRFVVTSMLDAFRYSELTGAVDAQFSNVRRFMGIALRDGVATGALRADLDVEATVEMLVAIMWGMASYGAFIGTHDQLCSAAGQLERLLGAEAPPPAGG